jgi:hypothetical protein
MRPDIVRRYGHNPILTKAENRFTGSTALPVLAVTVMSAPEPTFDVATANAAAPAGPGTCTIPSLLTVAASATGYLERSSR